MQNVSRKGLYKEDGHFSSEDMMLNVSRRGLCLCGGHFFQRRCSAECFSQGIELIAQTCSELFLCKGFQVRIWCSMFLAEDGAQKTGIFCSEDAVQNVSSMGLSNAAWGRFGFFLWRLRVP